MASLYGFTLKNRKILQGLDWQGYQGDLHYIDKKVAWYNDSGNGGSCDIVYYDNSFAPILQETIKRHVKKRPIIMGYGGNIYPGTINTWMKRICQTAGLEERTVHSLRHTNITMQIAAGVPIVTVAGRASHAQTSTTTDIYSRFLKTADRSAAQNWKRYSNEHKDPNTRCWDHFFVLFLKKFFRYAKSLLD